MNRAIHVARANGLLMPHSAWRAHQRTGVPFYVLAAFLMQETGGGVNEYGHDVDSTGTPRPFWGVPEVTQENYAVYLHERDLGVVEAKQFPHLGRRSQGVGPMQLTYYAYQDRADHEGGCWDPAVNIRVGAEILAEKYAVLHDWHKVARSWNGRESYAVEMDARFKEWQLLLDGE